jgi:uncharacterized protein YjiS (DUF1127 family)
MPAHPESASRPAARIAGSQPWLRRRLGLSFVALAFAWLRRRAEYRRQRRALLCLDDRLLRDVGLTRMQAERAPRWPF